MKFQPKSIRWMVALTIVVCVMGADAQNTPNIIAVVNGDNVTESEWITRMQNLHAQDFLASTQPVRFKALTGGRIALEALINSRLLMQYASKVSLLPSDAEVEAEVNVLRQREDVKLNLEKKVFTEDQLRSDIKLQKVYFNVSTINLSVSADEEKSYYERHPEQWGKPERWRLAMIRVATAAAVEKVRVELKKGTPFESVAAQFSEDPETKKKGGDIGMMNAGDPRLPEFIRDAVKKLKLGEVTAPLQAPPIASQPPQSYFLMRLTAKEDANVKPLDQVRSEVHRLALMEKATTSGAAEKKLADIRKGAKITIKVAGYEDLAAK